MQFLSTARPLVHGHSPHSDQRARRKTSQLRHPIVTVSGIGLQILPLMGIGRQEALEHGLQVHNAVLQGLQVALLGVSNTALGDLTESQTTSVSRHTLHWACWPWQRTFRRRHSSQAAPRCWRPRHWRGVRFGLWWHCSETKVQRVRQHCWRICYAPGRRSNQLEHFDQSIKTREGKEKEEAIYS
jgi:hypothetical protein